MSLGSSRAGVLSTSPQVIIGESMTPGAGDGVLTKPYPLTFGDWPGCISFPSWPILPGKVGFFLIHGHILQGMSVAFLKKVGKKNDKDIVIFVGGKGSLAEPQSK